MKYVTGKYGVYAICTNCGHKAIVNAEKGKEMPDKVECPNCGCYTLCPQKWFICSPA